VPKPQVAEQQSSEAAGPGMAAWRGADIMTEYVRLDGDLYSVQEGGAVYRIETLVTEAPLDGEPHTIGSQFRIYGGIAARARAELKGRTAA
jgi:hypothetical protein